MKKTSTLLLILACAAVSCKKEKDPDPAPGDPTDATITVITPAEDEEYEYDDTVFIKAKMTFNKTLHGCGATIINKDNNAVLFEFERHDHNDTLQLDTFWVNKVNAHTAAKITIHTTLDHDGKKTKKEINFHCHPM